MEKGRTATMSPSQSSLPTFSFSNTADEVASGLASEIKGKNVLITGTSMNGIGFETARAIAKYASLVVITGYNAERLKLSGEAIKKEFPAANIRTLVLDLSSFDAVRKAATEVNSYSEPLHVLINNAAATDGVYTLTVDNLEIQMAAGHFGPFLFTKLLYPKLLASATATWIPRIVFVASVQHTLRNGVPLETEEFARGHGGGDDDGVRLFMRYGEVKSANVLTAREFARRAGSKARVYSLDPGAIVTNAFRKGFQPALQGLGILDTEGKPNPDSPMVWKTLQQGGATTVVAAFDPRINDQSGAYLIDCVPAEERVAPHSSDMDRAKRLWELTEVTIGEKFEV
ncbi:hypothetical protein C8F01DRAFT_1112466 [Mycena amicta]|nr:hypothetical protein C8F01DRAFT_1112466 [Mycena amicta]